MSILGAIPMFELLLYGIALYLLLYLCIFCSVSLVFYLHPTFPMHATSTTHSLQGLALHLHLQSPRLLVFSLLLWMQQRLHSSHSSHRFALHLQRANVITLSRSSGLGKTKQKYALLGAVGREWRNHQRHLPPADFRLMNRKKRPAWVTDLKGKHFFGKIWVHSESTHRGNANHIKKLWKSNRQIPQKCRLLQPESPLPRGRRVNTQVEVILVSIFLFMYFNIIYWMSFCR